MIVVRVAPAVGDDDPFVAAIIAGVSFSDFSEALAATSVLFGVFTIFTTWMVAFLVDLGFFIWIGISEGEAGENRFGP